MVTHEITDTLPLYLGNGTSGGGDLREGENAVVDGRAAYLEWEFLVRSLNEGVYIVLGFDRFGHSPAHNLFLSACVPVGAICHAFVFGQIILFAERASHTETQNQERLLKLCTAMKALDISADLQLRIISSSTYELVHCSRGSVASLNRIFSGLSPQLRFELNLHVYTELVHRALLVKSSSTGFPVFRDDPSGYPVPAGPGA